MIWRVLGIGLLIAGLLAAPAIAAFPGRNGKIAFASPRNNLPNFEVYSMNPDGSEQTNLTNFPDEDLGPAWSADGRRLAFVTGRDDTGLNLRKIYTMDADGSNQRRLSFTPATTSESNPTWSPDGTQIMFHRIVPFAGQRDLYVINSGGFNETRVTQGGSSSQPAWSPNGDKVAFVSARDGQADIYVMNPDGSGQVRLTRDPTNENSPAWSPDGHRIAFERTGSCCPVSDIFVMDADGTGQTQVTSGPGGGASPEWSPDGSSIVFTYQVGFQQIYVMRADGSNPVNISNDPGAQDPSWQPLPNRPPECSGVRGQPRSLSPPNHKLRTVTLRGGADPDGDAVDVTVTGVTQDEPTGGRPDAVLGPAADQVRLRAERIGKGDGRVYRISFTATDVHGGSCTGKVRVGVRKGSRPAVDSAPPSYDSL